MGSNAPKFGTSLWTGYTVQNMYDAAAVLTVDLLSHPANRVIDSYALWYLFHKNSPPGGIVGGANKLATDTLASVKANAPAGLYDSVYIYTPCPLTASQEFIGTVPDGSMTSQQSKDDQGLGTVP